VKRFRVLTPKECREQGIDIYNDGDDYFPSYLVDFKDPEKPSVIASDNGEPEDNMFCRDYQWVAPLLNQLAEVPTE
jgi:hypothetical protein